jgi:hypothetical protein
MMVVLVMLADVMQTVYLPPENGGETANVFEASRETARAGKLFLEIGIDDAVEEFGPINRTSRHTKDLRQTGPPHCSNLLND